MATGLTEAQAAAAEARKLEATLDKVKATGGGVAFVFNSLAGPIALATGAAFGLLGAMTKILGTSRLVKSSLEEWAKVQIYTPQFEKLLGGLKQASDRLRDLSRQAANGPFKFEDLAEGNKRLEVFTRGALSGKAGMALIADSAAAAGVSVTEMSGTVGQLYDAVSNHQPIDGYLQQLRETGAISTQAANAITNLSYSGASSIQIWQAVADSLRGNKGAGDALRETISGLNSQLENAKGNQLASIGEMFDEGKTAGLQNSIALVDRLGPVVRSALAPIAALYNGFENFARSIGRAATAIPGFGGAIKGVATSLALLAAAISATAILEVVGVVGKLSGVLLGLGARAGVFEVIGAGFGLMGRQVLRLLGPVGLAVAALQGLLALTGKYGSSGVADDQKAMADGIRRTTAEIKAQTDALANGSAAAETRGDVLAKSAENVANAQTVADAARGDLGKQRGSSLLADVAGGAGLGAVGGAVVGTAVPVLGNIGGGIVGGLIGGIAGAVSHVQNVTAAAAQDATARKASEQAMAEFVRDINTQPRQRPADYLNNPLFEQAQAQSQGRLNDLSRSYQSLSEADRAGDKGAGIRGQLSAEAGKFSRDNLNLSFDKFITSEETQGRLREAIGSATGNRQTLNQGHDLEDAAAKSARVKDLVENGKFSPEDADQIAEGEKLQTQLERARGQNSVVASNRARLGMGIGEAAGGSSEEARILNKMLNIMEQQQTPTYQIPP